MNSINIVHQQVVEKDQDVENSFQGSVLLLEEETCMNETVKKMPHI